MASGGAATTYTYSLTSDFSADNNTDGIFSDLTAGTYTVYVKDANDCVDPTPITVTINELCIAIVKTASVGGTGTVGDVITYSFTVSNTGNVPLTGVTVTDPLGTVTGGPITLAVGGSDNTTFTMLYTITQDDINAGGVTNQATATGTDTNGNPVTDLSDDNSPLEDDETVTVLLIPPVADDDNATGTINTPVTVDALDGDIDPDGDDANLSITEIDGTPISVGNPVTLGDGTVVALNPDGTLEVTPPTDSTEPISFEYTLEDEDGLTDTGLIEVTFVLNPLIGLVKTGSLAGEGEVGDIITYTFVVFNIGNVPLTNISIDDDRIGLTNIPVSNLGVGETDTVTITYTLTQDDVNAGGVTNQAIVTGMSPNGTEVTDESDNETAYGIEPTYIPIHPATDAPSVLLKKEATGINGLPISSEYTTIGDVISYKITIENNGNATIYNTTVEDQNADTYPIYVSGDFNLNGILDVKEIWEYSAIHTVTGDDLARGEVLNIATGSGDADTDSDGYGDTPISGNSNEVTVTGGCKPVIPDGFSPNNDNKNDYFKMTCLYDYPNAVIEIYNRWSNLVYRLEGYGNETRHGTSAWWDGTSNQKWTVGGDKLLPGTYFYILYFNSGDKEPIKGPLFLNYGR